MNRERIERELALLRMVGASRRQLFRSVLSEAIVVGLAASLVGLGLGVLAAVALEALLGAFGVTLPAAPLVFEARTVVVALAVGVGVTVISAMRPSTAPKCPSNDGAMRTGASGAPSAAALFAIPLRNASFGSN